MMGFLGSIGYIMIGFRLQALYELIHAKGNVNATLNGKDISRETSTYIDLHHTVWIFDCKVV